MIGLHPQPVALRLPAPASLPPLVSALSRRSAIFGAMAVGAMPTAALAALDPLQEANLPLDPDADLLALGREWQASADRCDRANEALDAAAERMPEFVAPEAVFWKKGDGFAIGCLGGSHHTGQRWYGYPHAIKELKRSEFRDLCGRPWRRDVDRRDEIVAAYDGWVAAIAAAELASGYTAADAESDAANEQNRELRRRIMLMPAATLEGVLLKARVSGWCWSGSAEMREQTADDVRRGSTSGEDIAFSAVADLVAMIERGAA